MQLKKLRRLLQNHMALICGWDRQKVFLSGQGLRMLKRGQSAEDIVKEIVTEANEYLSLLSKKMEMH
jgi:hypothetical protein